jgi:hypothetical protein
MNPSRALAVPWPPAGGAAALWRRCWAVYAVLGGLLISPLLDAQVPPLVDYPNHLARMWVLAQDGRIAELARNYVVNWRVLPDLAMDLVVPGLSKLIGVAAAGRVFIAVTMLLLVGGTVTLHRVLHGRWAVWPVSSVLFVFNALLFWGFLNCLFGIGVYLFVFSGWIATQDWRLARRVLLFAGLACGLLLLHLFAFGLYGLSVALYELSQRIGRRGLSRTGFAQLCVIALQFVPGALLWYASLRHAGPTITSYGTLDDKLYALLSPFTFGFIAVPLDRAIGLLAFAVLVWGVATRSLTMAPQLRLPIAAMALVAAAMPNVLSGSWSADLRLPVALTFIVLAALRVEQPSRRTVGLFAVVALCLFAARIWAVAQSWHDYDRQFAEFRQATAVIKPGSRLMLVEASIMPKKTRWLPGLPASLAVLQPTAFIHLGALAVIDRSAFIPDIFTGWTTIDIAPRNEAVSERVALPVPPDILRKSADPETAKGLDTAPDKYGERPYWRDWPREFDYVAWFDFDRPPGPAPAQLQPLAGGSFFEIYRVRRPR